jgi:hypothetical protein
LAKKEEEEIIQEVSLSFHKPSVGTILENRGLRVKSEENVGINDKNLLRDGLNIQKRK